MWQWLWNYSCRWYYCRDHFYCVMLPQRAHFVRQFLVFTLFFSYCFGEIMCIRDSYMYWGQLCVMGTAMCIGDSYVYCGQLCLSNRWSLFFIHESYVRSVSRYCFIRNYAAIPVQLENIVLQYISWCVPIVWTFVFNQFSCFWQFLVDNFATPSCLFTYSVAASCSHSAVMCWIVSDSFPQLLHNSSVFGCFKIYFL